MLKKSLLLASLLLAVVEGLPSQEPALDVPLGGPLDSGITWTGRIEEDGDVISFTGLDLQDIETQIRGTNPNFSWSRAAEPGLRNPSKAAAEDILCDLSWNPPFASVFHIRQGVTYLRKIHGDCTNGPGPGNCSRVSCSYSSGIWFCNDNPHPVSVPCSAFGDRAWDIVEKCYAFGHFPTDLVHGQNFDPHGWNVIVAGVDC